MESEKRRVFTAVISTHRSIIIQLNFHHSLKDAILHLFRGVQLAHSPVEVVVQFACSFHVSSTMEIRLVAFLYLAVKSELGDWTKIV